MLGLIGRLVMAMGVVLCVMALAAKLARNRNLGGIRRGGHTATIEVLARQGFGKNASVAVVMAAGKALVLGVTDHTVTVLAEADPSGIQEKELPQQPQTVPGTQRTGSLVAGLGQSTFSW